MATLQHIAFTLVQTIACMVWLNVEEHVLKGFE